MAPMVTLYVGQEGVEFHAHEDTLCELRFFRLALEKSLPWVVAIPNESPAIVSVLIEYLYKKDYTYDKSGDFSSACPNPGEEGRSEALTEALFHIDVILASKEYDCKDLKTKALAHINMLVLDDVDQLRYWEVAYLTRADVISRKNYSAWGEVGAWVGRLFKSHSARLRKTLSDHPKLAHDMLLAATSP